MKKIFKKKNNNKTSELGLLEIQQKILPWCSDGRTLVYSASVDGAYQAFRVDTYGATEPVQLSNGISDVYVQDISGMGRRCRMPW